MRVVSLVPSVTETLLALGVTPIAVTRFCEQPALPHVGGTKNPDVAAIVALRPDLVVVNDEENRIEDAEALRAAGVAVHVTSVRTVDDVPPMLEALADAVGADRSLARCELPPPSRATLRRAFVPIWRRPWMTIGPDTFGASLLAHVGVANVFADATDRYPTVTLEEAAARRPDIVLVPTEPYAFKPAHLAELRAVCPEVREVDGQDLFWWGVRTPAAITRLAAAVAG